MYSLKVVVVLVAISAVFADVILQDVGSASTSAGETRGQSFLTPSGGPWTQVSYNFFSDGGCTVPTAAGNLYIFTSFYSGSIGGLPSAGALAVATTSNGIWYFPASFQLNANTRYYVFMDSSLPGNIAYENSPSVNAVTYFYSGGFFQLSTLEKFRLSGVSGPVAVCGNGIVESGEQCDGGSCCSTTCQFSSGNVCRASAGTCDVAETCSGSSASCPADSFVSSSTVCRVSTGVCDIAESCTGSSASCPADSFVSSSTVCRASAGVCDVAETCTGSSGSCPADSFASSSTVCRASAGVCDVAETCTGSGVSCPADSFQSSSTVCRPAASSCDTTESCTGSSASCPADVLSNAPSCFCARQTFVGGDYAVNYFCNGDGAFYECMQGPWAALSTSFNCAAGTHCGCAAGQECSCGGMQSPCVTVGAMQTC